jgi:hypothetical protein
MYFLKKISTLDDCGLVVGQLVDNEKFMNQLKKDLGIEFDMVGGHKIKPEKVHSFCDMLLEELNWSEEVSMSDRMDYVAKMSLFIIQIIIEGGNYYKLKFTVN